MKIHIIEENSPFYPDSLRQIAGRPKRLYCAGDLDLLKEDSIAVIGSRKYTMYGKNVAEMIGARLASANIPVISGMALGIDTFAHTGLLEHGGRPIAVLGTGLNKPYPKRNEKLFEEIVGKGLAISEYEPDFEGRAYSFPERNRIIAGLAKVLVVIEAKMNSGSLITAQFGAEQGKTIYAVPGNINSQFSMGSNLLIRDGATPLIVIDDLLRELHRDVPASELAKLNLGEDEITVYEEVGRWSGVSVDDISHNLNKKPQVVNAILTILEIKGAITSYNGKVYLAK